MKKVTFLIVLLVFISACASPGTPQATSVKQTDVQELAIRLADTAAGGPLTLLVDYPPEQVKPEDLQLILPEGFSILSQTTGKQGQTQYQIQTSGAGLAEFGLSVSGAQSFEQPVFVYLPGQAGTKIDSPMQLSATLSPEPVVGGTVHIQALAKALVDSPNTTLEIRLPAGLTLISGETFVQKDLAANETLELSAEVRVEQAGELPVEVEALSRPTSETSWGRSQTFYLQVGTSLGNTITAFPESAIDDTEQLPAEQLSTQPAPQESPLPPKQEGRVAPAGQYETVLHSNHSQDQPLPPGVIMREVSAVLGEPATSGAGQSKPEQVQDDRKQVPPDPPLPGGPPPDNKPEAPVPEQPLPLSPVGWNTIMSETFESSWPTGLWQSFDGNGSDYGNYCWDDDDYLPHNGTWSAWPANGCANGLDPAIYYYPNNLDSWMVYGPFDLSDADDADLNFYYWNESEPGYDEFQWYASANGSNFYGWGVSGDSGGWVSQNLDLSGYVGDASVWIAFKFVSDSTNYDDGAFVDDISLVKHVPPGPLTVSGTWYYVDKDHVTNIPMGYARIELWDVDAGGTNDLMATTYANSSGYYSITFTNNDLDDGGGVDLFARVYTTDDYSVNVRTGGASNTLYYGQTSTANNLPNGSYSFGGWWVGQAPPFIYAKIGIDAWNYLLNTVSWNNNYNLQVRWNSTSTDGSYYNGTYIALVAGDAYDEDVILHEYGHFTMDKIYTTYPPTPNCNPHNWGVHSSLGCAWSEGWATYLQGAIQNHPNYVDTVDQTINYSMEPPSPWSDHPQDEGAVGASLWDIFDGGAAEAFDTLAAGIDETWTLVRNNDPLDVNGFRNLWYASAYGDNCKVGSILDHHAIAHNYPGYTLTKSISPGGTGTITAIPGTNCVGGEYVPGTSVQLTASPYSGYGFTMWSGSLSGSANPATLAMNADKTVTANFLLLPGAFNKSSPANGASDQLLNPTLNWGSSSGATSYQYCYDTSNDNACSVWSSTGMETHAHLSGLSLNTTYYWQVRAVNAGGPTYANGSSTAYWSFTTGNVPGSFAKSSPPNGAIDQLTSLTLTWGTSSQATSYEYCYDTSDDGACNSWINNGTSTSATLSGLNYATTYYWHVRAINGFGTTYSNWGSPAYWLFTTGSRPTGFSKSTPANNTVGKPASLTLSWAASAGATSYKYCYDTTNDNACSGWVGNGSATSAAISGLSPATKYYWQVRAVNQWGFTPANGGTWWAFSTRPGAFGKLAPAHNSGGKGLHLTLSWNPSAGATAYQYCIDQSVNGACNTSWVNVGLNTSVVPPGLARGKTYSWQVRSVFNGGYTQANSGTWWTFSTLPGIFNKISPVNGAVNRPLNPTLTWSSSSGALQYQYCIDKIAGTTCNTSWISAGKNLSVTLSGLTRNTTYYWQVRAVRNGGYTSANGGWWSFKTVP